MEREREILSRLHTQHGVWHRARSHSPEVMTWAKIMTWVSCFTNWSTLVPVGCSCCKVLWPPLWPPVRFYDYTPFLGCSLLRVPFQSSNEVLVCLLDSSSLVGHKLQFLSPRCHGITKKERERERKEERERRKALPSSMSFLHKLIHNFIISKCLKGKNPKCQNYSSIPFLFNLLPL